MPLPINEIFYSVQGEGVYSGTPMVFIRTAGCNVGVYVDADDVKSDDYVQPVDFRLLVEKKHSICTAVGGNSFLCDTDYHATEKLEDDEIVRRALSYGKVRHACITGGEPFLHGRKITNLCATLLSYSVQPHIETSGTINMQYFVDAFDGRPAPWITCCPKAGFLGENYHFPNEWKFLVSKEQDEIAIRNFLRQNDPRPVYIQPINTIRCVDNETLNIAMSITLANPRWRLSPQLHKYLGVR